MARYRRLKSRRRGGRRVISRRKLGRRLLAQRVGYRL